MIKIAKIFRTCTACPSQWDAWDEEGTYYYIRFRHGHFRVEKGEVLTGEKLLECDIPGEDGYLTFSQMQDITKDIFDFSNCVFQDETADENFDLVKYSLGEEE